MSGEQAASGTNHIECMTSHCARSSTSHKFSDGPCMLAAGSIGAARRPPTSRTRPEPRAETCTCVPFRPCRSELATRITSLPDLVRSSFEFVRHSRTHGRHDGITFRHTFFPTLTDPQTPPTSCLLPCAIKGCAESHQSDYPIHRRPYRTAAAWAAARPCDYSIGQASCDRQGATDRRSNPPGAFAPLKVLIFLRACSPCAYRI